MVQGLSSLAFSPDGQRLAGGSYDHIVYIRTTPDNSPAVDIAQTLQGHSGWVTSVSWSPDGQRLASASADATLRLWNSTAGTCTMVLRGHSAAVHSVAYSQDGSRLLSGGHDAMRIWRATCEQIDSRDGGWAQASGHTGDCLKTLRGHGAVYSAAWSPDCTVLASGGRDSTVRIWDPVTGDCLKTLRGHSASVTSVAYSPDGRMLASGSSDSTVRIWDPVTGDCLKTLRGHSDKVTSVAYSHGEGECLASGSSDSTLRIWDAATGQCVETLENGDSVTSVAWSPNNRKLACANTGGGFAILSIS